MYVTVNDQRLNKYVLDSVKDIKERISAVMFNGTPIKYLSITPELVSPSQTDNFAVVSMINPFLNQKTIDFPINVYERYKQSLKRPDVEKLFIATNLTLDRAQSTAGNNVVSHLLSAIKNIETPHPNEIWETRAKITDNYYKEQRKLIEKVNDQTQMQIDFENIPMVEVDNLEQSNVQFSILFEPSNITLNELFNRMTLTKFIPYINYGDLFKIRYAFSADLEWLEYETTNAILMKIDSETDNELNILKNVYKKYTNVAFTVIKDENEMSQIIATLDLSTGTRNVDRNELLSRVLESINMSRSSIQKTEDISWTGYFSFPRQTLLIPVWTELAMNNKYFNIALAVDESVRASKTKQNIFMHLISRHGTEGAGESEGKHILTLSMQLTEKNDYFIRARIKTRSTIDALRYRNMIARFFTIYNNEKDGIIHEYRKFIPTFMRDEERRILSRTPTHEEPKNLRSIAPDLFIPTYSRKCLKRPTIISDTLRSEYERTKQFEVMQYPIFGEGTQRNYICEHQTHPFPGLRDNKLENRDQYPYLPCCYTKNQKNKQGSKYMYYFEQRPRAPLRGTKHPSSSDLFLTEKILEPNMPGVLPKKIKRLFSLIQADSKYCFIRVGAQNNSNSVLESVLRGLKNDTSRTNVIKQLNQFLTTDNAMAARQEMYDETAETILKYMRVNLKASNFVHSLEETFNLDIFIFSADTLIIPRHSQMYLKAVPTRRVMFLFQHKRSDDGHNQCEIIAKVRSDDTKHLNRQYIFQPDDITVKEIWKVFNQMTRTVSPQSVSLGRPEGYPLRGRPEGYPQISFTKRFDNIVSQHIDMNGKCRLINIKFQTGNVTELVSFVCDPLPPFAVQSAVNINRTRHKKVIQEFVNTYDIELVDQIQSSGHICEINAILCGTHKITFLVNLQEPLSLPLSTEQPRYLAVLLPAQSENIVTIFGHNRKIAKILYQYALYIMSIYLFSKNKRTPLTDQEFIEFVHEKIVIIPNFNYSKVTSSKFDLSSQFIRDGKLVLPSNESLKRLLFMVKLFQSTKFEELLKYRTHITINQYFENISDYDPIANGIILQGEQTVRDLILSSYQNILVDRVIVSDKPYFFKNTILGDHIFLAKNYKTLNDALNANGFWLRHGFIPDDAPLAPHPGNSSAIYLFKTTEDIELITGNPTDGIILGCKINNDSIYTSLFIL